MLNDIAIPLKYFWLLLCLNYTGRASNRGGAGASGNCSLADSHTSEFAHAASAILPIKLVATVDSLLV